MNKNKAILIECDPNNSLGGSCIRDINNFCWELYNNQLIENSNITIFTTSEVKNKILNVKYKKTQNLLYELKNFKLKTDDFLFILLTGHGYNTIDKSGDEIDNKDEYINTGNGKLLDDDFYNELILKNLEVNAKIIFLADTCSSGTILDLDYILDQNNKFCLYTKRKLNKNQNIKLDAISISACHDNEYSQNDLGQKFGFGGSLSLALLENNLLKHLFSIFNNKTSLLYIKKIISERLKKLYQNCVFSSLKEKILF